MANVAMHKIMNMGYDDRRPDKHKQRQQWNASWERDLNDAYKMAMQPRRGPKMVSAPEVKKVVRDSMQQLLLTQEKQLQSIIELQKDIVEYASIERRCEDVEAASKGIDDATRRYIVLEALYNVSNAGPDMEGYRKWCPDMTIASLCEKNGATIP
ncbi:hypothetical protein D9619_004951 [Psilocybe cf. subviscida]|uniref:Uncharacterized protein n=1 Tax=Psilocybe cf. subviscida TaxID=2480587 RepID=A0A8H5F8I8_9AGAR|nr:hypothetical protein D9619_004951 [Psilocybe cf. subviscida]